MHHLGSGIWSQTLFMTGAIFRVGVPATIIRSDCLGLGRNTPAPNLSISKREAPVAIISMAQHASPNVMGHSADFRAQLKTKSTVVVIIPLDDSMVCSFCFTISYPSGSSVGSRALPALRPFKGSLAPRVIITHYQYSDENQHLNQTENRQPVIYYGPWEEKDCFNVKNQKEHRYHIEPDREPLAGVADWIDAAFIGHQLVAIENTALEQTRDAQQCDRHEHRHQKENDNWNVSVYRRGPLVGSGPWPAWHCLKQDYQQHTHRFFILS